MVLDQLNIHVDGKQETLMATHVIFIILGSQIFLKQDIKNSGYKGKY